MQYNVDDIERHIKKITSRWNELVDDPYFEIRCIKENFEPHNQKFKRSQIDDAIKFACKNNAEKYNVYITVNPISSRSNGRSATDQDIIASFFCFCDCDTVESVKNVNKIFSELKGNFGVYTGQKPVRGHIYFELNEPCYDMETWTNIQKGIAQKIDSDPSVHNPSRILRLSGTINYPTKNKQIKGRVVEISKFTNYRSDIKTVETLKKFFPYQSTSQNFAVNLGDMSAGQRLDIQQSLNQIRSGVDWHDNMIRVVGSLVAQGCTDKEIHMALFNITLPGYSQADTDKEVDIAIKGAREKGYEKTATKPIITKSENGGNLFTRWQHKDPMTIPKREFLYSNHYIKSYCTLTVSPGGLGKSTLAVTEALAMVTGRNLLNVQPIKKCKVLYFNSEDPRDEIERRVLALCQYYEIDQSELEHFHIGSGRDMELLLMIGDNGLINDHAFEQLQDEITKNDIDLLILDPLANMHTSSESVENFRTLGKALSMLADVTNCCIEIVHHTRKINANTDVTVEDARGGSSLIGAVRSARVLTKMSKSEGENLGLDNYIDFFALEPGGKHNLSRPLDKKIWYQKIGVQLPQEDWIAVCQAYTPPSAFDGITMDKLRLLHKAIGDSELHLMSNIRVTRNEYKMSVHEFISDYLDMDFDAPVTRTKMKRMVTTWLKNDLLVEKNMSAIKVDPKNYRKNNTVKVIKLGEKTLNDWE